MKNKDDLLSFFGQNQIKFAIHEHSPVYTCGDAAIHLKDLPGIGTKNLFLRNKKGDRHYLVSVPDEKIVNLKILSEVIGEGSLSFASPERLRKYLGVEPGSVTILGLINDLEQAVDAIIDKKLWEAELVHCHPLVNTATVLLGKLELREFFKKIGREVRVMEVPEK